MNQVLTDFELLELGVPEDCIARRNELNRKINSPEGYFHADRRIVKAIVSEAGGYWAVFGVCEDGGIQGGL